MYKLYGQRKQGSWEVIKTSSNLNEIEKECEKLTSKEYFSYIIKEITNDRDILIKQQSLFKECKVEYSDDVNVDFQVKAIEFKPTRMKKKEQLRKEIQDYIDR